MTQIIPIETERLILRPWRDTDRVPFAALNADPEVMRHFPSPLTRGESDELADRIASRMAERGWGSFAVEVKGGEPFIGFVGPNAPSYDLPCGPCVEIGWRLLPIPPTRASVSRLSRWPLTQALLRVCT